MEAVDLAHQGRNRADVLVEGRPVQTVVDARTGLDAIEAGEALHAEQVGVVEFQIEAILVGDAVAVAADGADHRHDDGFEDLVEIEFIADERHAPFERSFRHHASRGAGENVVARGAG